MLKKVLMGVLYPYLTINMLCVPFQNDQHLVKKIMYASQIKFSNDLINFIEILEFSKPSVAVFKLAIKTENIVFILQNRTAWPTFRFHGKTELVNVIFQSSQPILLKLNRNVYLREELDFLRKKKSFFALP